MAKILYNDYTNSCCRRNGVSVYSSDSNPQLSDNIYRILLYELFNHCRRHDADLVGRSSIGTKAIYIAVWAFAMFYHHLGSTQPYSVLASPDSKNSDRNSHTTKRSTQFTVRQALRSLPISTHCSKYLQPDEIFQAQSNCEYTQDRSESKGMRKFHRQARRLDATCNVVQIDKREATLYPKAHSSKEGVTSRSLNCEFEVLFITYHFIPSEYGGKVARHTT
ncbi:uncharacterized protein RAG0_14099 [Rhynchosporium agropyri]|uniref:Uncharacterized protein n=1 Tax=Rhynchosporium agropyri TaxID=914238 RepID=A0A1E1LFL7_9HELO|nr:uncharacterized protein RAG0_14099 [Rhynchosporium agropyri]